MKKIKLILTILVLNLSFISCDSLNQTLQYANMGLGGVCLQTSCSSGYYNSNTKTYKMGYSLTADDNGKNIENSENRWIDSKMNESLNSGIGVYYHTSPYSDVEYKFVVNCVEWQQK